MYKWKLYWCLTLFVYIFLLWQYDNKWSIASCLVLRWNFFIYFYMNILHHMILPPLINFFGPVTEHKYFELPKIPPSWLIPVRLWSKVNPDLPSVTLNHHLTHALLDRELTSYHKRSENNSRSFFFHILHQVTSSIHLLTYSNFPSRDFFFPEKNCASNHQTRIVKKFLHSFDVKKKSMHMFNPFTLVFFFYFFFKSDNTAIEN